jgi:membrane-associated phospholipid phosphatase
MQRQRLIIALGLLVVAVFFTYYSSFLIGRCFPNRPLADDLFFKVVPHFPQLSYLSDALVIVALGLLLYVVSKQPKLFSLVVSSIAIMWIIRAFLNVLTPLADPSGDSKVYGFLETTPLYGMFPSGHTATIFITYFWSRLIQSGSVSVVLLIIGLLEIFSLWATRGHYTIDIVAGIVLAYAVVTYLNNNYGKLVTVTHTKNSTVL